MYCDMKLIKDAGANIVRASHNPHPRSFYRACDELGLMIYAELHLWGRGGFKGGVEGTLCHLSRNEADHANFDQTLKANFRTMLKERRNHPSIIIWGLGNEIAFHRPMPQVGKLRQLCLDLQDMSHAMDPTRPTSTGHSFIYEFLADVSGYNGGQPKEQPREKPTITTEFHHTMEPARDAWRSGAICWSAFDYGTHFARPNGVSFGGFHGAIDYYRLPKEKYYLMRRDELGIPVPENRPLGRASWH